MNIKTEIRQLAKGIFVISVSCLGYLGGAVLMAKIVPKIINSLLSELFKGLFSVFNIYFGGVPFGITDVFSDLLLEHASPLGGLIGFQAGKKLADPLFDASTTTLIFMYQQTKQSFFWLSDMANVSSAMLMKSSEDICHPQDRNDDQASSEFSSFSPR